MFNLDEVKGMKLFYEKVYSSGGLLNLHLPV